MSICIDNAADDFVAEWLAARGFKLADGKSVVLDLAQTKGGALLPDWLRFHATEIARDSAGGNASVADDLRYIANQIEAQTRPPRPAEPTDPAVRVIDCGGDVWASHEGRWGCLTDGADPLTWGALVTQFGPLEVRP